jgi:hypothetical protein
MQKHLIIITDATEIKSYSLEARVVCIINGEMINEKGTNDKQVLRISQNEFADFNVLGPISLLQLIICCHLYHT